MKTWLIIVKNDHRSKFSNFKQLERRSLKKSGLQRDSNPWPPRYRCDALPTELWNHTLGAGSIYWVHIFPCSKMMWSLYEIIHICTAVVDESESRWRPDFFQASSLKLLKIGKFTAMITLHFHLQPQYKYELFHINFTSFYCTGRYELNNWPRSQCVAS